MRELRPAAPRRCAPMATIALALAGAVACGDVATATDAAIDGGIPAIDAPIDAGEPPPPPVPGQELSAGAGRLTGAGWIVDVQLGTTFDTPALAGGTWTLRGGAPINP